MSYDSATWQFPADGRPGDTWGRHGRSKHKPPAPRKFRGAGADAGAAYLAQARCWSAGGQAAPFQRRGSARLGAHGSILPRSRLGGTVVLECHQARLAGLQTDHQGARNYQRRIASVPVHGPKTPTRHSSFFPTHLPGITRVLAEGGGRVAAALLGAGAADRIAWFRAPDIMGSDGVPMAEAFGVDKLSELATFERRHSLAAGRDILEIYERLGRAAGDLAGQ